MGRSRSRDRHKRRRSTSKDKRYRSRSRSPRRRRSRSKSRERSSRRDRERDRSRDRGYRERERGRERDRERDKGRERASIRSKTPEEDPVAKVTEGASSGEEKLTEEELEMKRMMGFAKFKTTKGKHVPGSNNASAMNIKTEKKYRQYMNRRGGFNRPLDPMN